MDVTGDEWLKRFEALANPHRLRIIAALKEERKYVSELARAVRMSRPLLYLHLQRLEAAGLVAGKLELSEDGKAMKYYELAPFEYRITADTITNAVRTLTVKSASDAHEPKEEE